METLYTCLVTIVGGILLGILLSKLLLLLLYKFCSLPCSIIRLLES